jgi:ABC-type nitrate/sulfonate/bicarbonate transport system substrate-binding protein
MAHALPATRAAAVLALVLALTAGCGSAGGAPAPKPAASASSNASPSAGGTPASTTPGAPAPSPESGSDSSAGSTPLVQVNAAWAAITADQATFLMAQAGGYFKQQGLDVHMQYVAGGQVGMASLISGQLQFLQGGGTAVADAVAGGAPVRMAAGFINYPVFLVMTTPSITKPSQIPGTTWAVTRVGVSPDYFDLVAYLQHVGLKISQVTTISANSSVGSVAAVVGGHAQGILVSPPNNVLAEEKANMHELYNTNDLGFPEQNAGLMINETWAKAHPAVVEAFIRACIQGIHRFKTDRAFAYQVMEQYFKYTDPKVLAAGYDAFAKEFSVVPTVTVPGMQRILQEVAVNNPKAKAVPVSDTVDNSYVNAVVKSGFIQQVYGPGAGGGASSS